MRDVRSALRSLRERLPTRVPDRPGNPCWDAGELAGYPYLGVGVGPIDGARRPRRPPLVVIPGLNDPLARATAERLPAGSLSLLDGVGHEAVVGDHAAFDDSIRRFLAE